MTKSISAQKGVVSAQREPDRSLKISRSELMSRVRQRNTTPELAVRKVLHALGFRYRLHRRNLPGSPDIVLPKYRTVVFVHGCFWHRHAGCRAASVPKTRVDFWREKFQANINRDKKNEKSLVEMGWRVEPVWECETKSSDTLLARIERIFS